MPWSKRGFGIDELRGSRLTTFPCSKVFPDPNPQEDDAKFFGFSKNAEDGRSQSGRPSKTFPEEPNEFRASCGNPESQLTIPRGLGIFKCWLGTWGYSGPARCFRIIKFYYISQKIHLILQVLNLNQKGIYNKKFSHGEFINFQLSNSISFCTATSS